MTKALHALKPLFCTFVHKNFSSCRLKFPVKNCRLMYGKSKTNDQRNRAQVRPPKFVSRALQSFAVKLKFTIPSFFFQNSYLPKNYLTLDSHTNTVISHAVVYLSRWFPNWDKAYTKLHVLHLLPLICWITLSPLIVAK